MVRQGCWRLVLQVADTIKDFYVVKDEENLKVSKQHNCYYQIQGQLLLSGLEFCDFVVYTRIDMYTTRMYRYVEFINALVSNL